MTTTPTELPKLYSMHSIGVATFFCSLLAGGYLLHANYKALGMRKLAYYTLAASVLVFVFLMVAMSIYIDGTASAPDELPQLSITLSLIAAVAQAIIAVLATQSLQGAMFATFNEMQGPYHSTWHAFFVGLCAAFVLSLPLTPFVAALAHF